MSDALYYVFDNPPRRDDLELLDTHKIVYRLGVSERYPRKLVVEIQDKAAILDAMTCVEISALVLKWNSNARNEAPGFRENSQAFYNRVAISARVSIRPPAVERQAAPQDNEAATTTPSTDGRESSFALPSVSGADLREWLIDRIKLLSVAVVFGVGLGGGVYLLLSGVHDAAQVVEPVRERQERIAADGVNEPLGPQPKRRDAARTPTLDIAEAEIEDAAVVPHEEITDEQRE